MTGVDQRIYNRTGAPIPKGHVLTPGGYRRKSLVRKSEKGFYHRRRKDEIQLVERSTNRIHKRELVPDPSGLQPQIGSGWITYCEWNRPAGTTIKRIYTRWVVPRLPLTANSQTIFLFNALQNESRDEIVQPVLQFGSSVAGDGDGGWCIGNWHVASSGIAYPSDVIPVQPGETITGVITLVSQPNGKFTYVSQFVEYPQVDLTIPEIDELTCACLTLEAYQISTNDDYPASDFTSMTSIEIDPQPGFSNIPWTRRNPYVADGQSSNVSNPNNPGGQIDIFYR